MSDLTHLANEVRMVCQRISRRVRFEGTTDVAPHQFSVLVRVLDHPRTPTQLAETERVSTPSITRTINGLQGLGLVTRAPHPSDGRQVLVSATDAGREVVAATLTRRDTWMAERLATLSPQQLDVLREAVQILGEVAQR